MKVGGKNGLGSSGGAPGSCQQRSGMINPVLRRGQARRLEIVRAMAIVLTRRSNEGSARAAPVAEGV